jgi:3-oxoadipate enol-lactonase
MEITANGVRLQVIEAGQGDPVICIHGNGLNRELWRHLMPELSNGNRAVVYELRGMGLSQSVELPGTTVTVQDHAEDLAALMDALDIDRVAIVAHAFGGFPAMHLAIDQPERISALVMTCTCARMEGATREVIPYWIETAETEGMGPLVESGLERWFTAPFRAGNVDIMHRYRRMIGANPPLGYAANGRGILAYDVRDRLHEIRCPVLLISGKEDRSTPTADHQLIADRVGKAELIVVGNASHTVPEEQPQRFNSIVLDFLDREASI